MSNFKLTSLQEKVLEFFGESEFGRNFYWTGGTLLAFKYFDHRFSTDLDFFSDELYRDDEYLIFINELKRTLAIDKVDYIIDKNRRFLNLHYKKDLLKVEMVYFPFPAIEKREVLESFGMEIDSLSDALTNKTLATYQRKEIKDVYDLYYALKNDKNLTLKDLIDRVDKKFGVSIDLPSLIAKINTLTSDLEDLQPLLYSEKKDISTKVKKFFQKRFNKIASMIFL